MAKNVKYTGISLALAVAALFTATSASAALSVTVGGTPLLNEGQVSSVVGAVTTDFNGSLLNPAGYTGGGVVNGSSGGQWASPPLDTSNYFTVGPSTSTPGVIDLTGLASYFGYYGGSPDTYNSVEFYNGSTLVGSFSGTQLATFASVLPNGDQAVASYWNFTANSTADYFNKVQFISTQNAFETDNHAVLLVPEPESFAMMLAGLGMVGFMTYRRKNNT